MSMPYIVSEAVWNAKAVSQDVDLHSDFERCQVVVVEITTTAFSGTLDIKGKLHELSALSNVPYIRQDQASIQTPSVSQLSFTTDTGVYRYVILGYWRKLQLSMARTAGSITCGVVGSSHASVFPYLLTKLLANSGTDIGDVDVLSIAAGTNIIGKVGHDVTGITSGSKAVTTAGTAERLAAASIGAKWTLVQAKPANTTRVAVGGSTVDETPASVLGTILYPGESVWLPLDPYLIYCDPATSGEGATYNALT